MNNKMMTLVELNEGERKELVSGSLEEIVVWLQNNPDEYIWIRDNEKSDPSFSGEYTEMPDFTDIGTLKDLENELSKIDLSWWTLVIE